jgi:FkbM family methyltransferase
MDANHPFFGPAKPATRVEELVPTDPIEISARLWAGIGYSDTATRSGTAYYIGANCGQNLALIASRYSTVHCFEPSPRSYAILESLAANYSPPAVSTDAGRLPTVACHNIAVSDHNGSVVLADLPGRPHETGQLVTPGVHGMDWDPGNWDTVSKENLLNVACFTVDTLSEIYGVPDFVAMDTEGHEWNILQGMGHTLLHYPTLLIEFHSPSNYDNITRVLRSHGYKVETIRHPHFRPQSRMWGQLGWIKASARKNQKTPPVSAFTG